MPTVITELSLGAIECRLQYCQGRLVLWANDLAEIYNISPAKLLECMRRHGPFPGELAFWADAVEVGAFQDDDQEGGPHQVFTEHGALVMAYLIGTDVAIARSIRVLQAFTCMEAGPGSAQRLSWVGLARNPRRFGPGRVPVSLG